MDNKDKQILISIAKSMHRCVLTALSSKKEPQPKNPVEDVLDRDNVAEAPKDSVHAIKTGVMYKTEDLAKKMAEVVIEKYLESKKK
jgi:hypothetical protein